MGSIYGLKKKTRFLRCSEWKHHKRAINEHALFCCYNKETNSLGIQKNGEEINSNSLNNQYTLALGHRVRN